MRTVGAPVHEGEDPVLHNLTPTRVQTILGLGSERCRVAGRDHPGRQPDIARGARCHWPLG
eukprot:234865-Lingulodinium_polyedra.AAC.1